MNNISVKIYFTNIIIVLIKKNILAEYYYKENTLDNNNVQGLKPAISH
jgi:hypothetical protein